jgi:hypothetical protein
MEHNKYMNNYDYHRALFLLDGIPFLTNNFLIVRENGAYPTPVSVVHYEYYTNLEDLEAKLASEKELIQCRVGLNGLPLGSSQQPDILDYADTNKYKTSRSITSWDGNGTGVVFFYSGNWRSTSAISTVTLTASTGSFTANSSFALYGIKG